MDCIHIITVFLDVFLSEYISCVVMLGIHKLCCVSRVVSSNREAMGMELWLVNADKLICGAYRM